MTRKIFVTDLLEIEKVKVVCRKCGFSVALPLRDHYKSLGKCASCGAGFPSGYVDALVEEIRNLRTALKRDGNYCVAVEFETGDTGQVPE